MTVLELLFGRRPKRARKTLKPPRLEIIDAPPEDADWHRVTPRPGDQVRASLARRDGVIQTAQGPLSLEAGEHYIVRSKRSGVAVVRRDIFEKTYQRRWPWFGGYVKRPGIVYRYFTLSRPVVVKTEEGPQRAEAGDWIMQGVVGELWPVPSAEAEAKYIAIDEPQPEPVSAH